MKRLLWSAGALACLLLPAAAAADTCEARYQAAGGSAPKDWVALGEVNGTRKEENCLAKAKNEAGNLDVKAVGLTKEKVCAAGGKVSLSVSLKVDGKRTGLAASVSSALGVACPK